MTEITAIFLRAVGTVAVLSLIIVALLPLRRAGERLSARSRYIIWTLIILRMLLPMSMLSGNALISLEIPQSAPENAVEGAPERAPAVSGEVILSTPVDYEVEYQFTPEMTEILTDSSVEPFVAERTPASPQPASKDTFDIGKYLTPGNFVIALIVVWALGAVIFVAIRLISHAIFVSKLRRAELELPREAIDIFEALVGKLSLRRAPRLAASAEARGPMLVGILRPTVYLPPLELSAESLFGVLSHELTHYRRRDLIIKLIATISLGINWWNPLVHIAYREMMQCMELSCDEAVLRGQPIEIRRSYGAVMLDIARLNHRNCPGITTHFSPKGRALAARFRSILDLSIKSKGRAAIAIVLVLCMICGGIIGCKPAEGESDKPETDDRFEGVGDIAMEGANHDLYAFLDYADTVSHYIYEPMEAADFASVDLTYFVFWQALHGGVTEMSILEGEDHNNQLFSLTEDEFAKILADGFGVSADYLARYDDYSFQNKVDGYAEGKFNFITENTSWGKKTITYRCLAEIVIEDGVYAYRVSVSLDNRISNNLEYRFEQTDNPCAPYKLLSVRECEENGTKFVNYELDGEFVVGDVLSVLEDGVRTYYPVNEPEDGIISVIPDTYGGPNGSGVCVGVIDGIAYFNVCYGSVWDVYVCDIEGDSGYWMSGAEDFMTYHAAPLLKVGVDKGKLYRANQILSISPDGRSALVWRNNSDFGMAGKYYLRELSSGDEMYICESFSCPDLISWMVEYSDWIDSDTLRLGVYEDDFDTSVRTMTFYDVVRKEGEWGVYNSEIVGCDGLNWIINETVTIPETAQPEIDLPEAAEISTEPRRVYKVIPCANYEIHGEPKLNVERAYDYISTVIGAMFEDSEDVIVRLNHFYGNGSSFVSTDEPIDYGVGGAYFDYFRAGVPICEATRCGGGGIVFKYTGEGDEQEIWQIEDELISELYGNTLTEKRYPTGNETVYLDDNNRVLLPYNGDLIATPATFESNINNLEECYKIYIDGERIIMAGLHSTFATSDFFVHTSLDGGKTWDTQILDYTPTTTQPVFSVTDIALSFADEKNGAIVLGTQRAELFIYRTHDGGRSWERVSNFKLLRYRISAKVMAAFVTDDIGIICLGPNDEMNPNIYVSYDGGVNWAMLPTEDFWERGIVRGLTPYYDGDRIVIPCETLSGATPSAISTDGGKTWEIFG